MAIQTTSNLSYTTRTLYGAKYLEAAAMERLYDQLAQPVGQVGVETAARMGTTIRVPFLSDMTPGVTAISQTADITPQVLRDAYAEVSPTSRGEALQWAEALDVSAFTDYGAKRFAALGKNQMESVDILARDVALQGSLISRYTTRILTAAATAAHRLSDAAMSEANSMLLSLKCPAFIGNGRKQWFAIMHPATYHDLRMAGNIVNVGVYQDKEIILNMELGQLGPFKIIVSPFAKVFYGQGVVNPGTSHVSTLNGAVKALDKSIIVASATGVSIGRWINILDVAETGNTHSPTNERVKWVSGTTTCVIVGEGANGGLRFDHPSGVVTNNSDSVYPVVYGGPTSIAKAFDAATGEFGKTMGPTVTGLLEQFAAISWKYYGGYGRWVESWLLRGEYSSSLDV